ncbi:MAG: hypothetical protein MUE40_15590 [Anaerolineae bacterium]|nr:hypothetical protein [Anaerolineae bacterium]
MKALFDCAWHRFSVISSIISDANARAVAVFFYFTFLLPFGIISSLFTDPLHRKGKAEWHDRQPVPTDLDSAKQQG